MINNSLANSHGKIVKRHGGQILVDQLRIQGVDRVFCIPGESYLAALDGLYNSGIDVITARQESGAAMMAEASGKLTGKAGICFVTRGPGATNASAGVHIAFQDSTPMILFIGQVGTDHLDREAFQEVDYRQMYQPLAKWVEEVKKVERLPEYISRAFHIAMSGRPGPVVLSLPEDMLSSHAEIADIKPACPAQLSVDPQAVLEIINKIKSANSPFILIGGSQWNESAFHNIAFIAERLGVPVGAAFRCQDYMDNRHPYYVGDVGIGLNPALAERIRASDLLLVLGARLGEMTTGGYQLITCPTPQIPLIHIHPDPNEIGRVYQATEGLACNPADFLDVAANFLKQEAISSPPAAERTAYESWQQPVTTAGKVKLEQVINYLSSKLPEDAILTNGAGNYTAWLHRYFRYKHYGTQLAPTSGSMGYGLPAAIAAKRLNPEKTVICLAGDGCFQMTMQELGTAAHYGLAIIVIIVNNGLYGTIRMHQQRTYPDRPVATELVNPDFVKLVESYGGFGVRVEEADQIEPAIDAALAANKLTLIELCTDPRAVTPSTAA